MHVGILGAAGQLGRKVLHALGELGGDHTLVALVRTPSKLDDWIGPDREVRPADYEDIESLRTAFTGLDRVLLIPSKAPPPQRVAQYDNAINAAREVGVAHLLHYGILGTALESQSMLMPFMLYAESALRTCGLAWTVLRNGLYLDPIVDWVPDIVRMGTIPYPTGDGRCAYVTRDDIAAAGAGALLGNGHEGRTYSLTGPAALTTADLCDTVAKVTGQPVVDRRATDDDYRAVCRESGEPEFIVNVLLKMYHGIADGEMDIVTDDVEHLTGRPAASFEAVLRAERGTG